MGFDVEKHLVYLVETGSRAYGTNMVNSDTDYRGVCVPPISYYLGTDSFGTYNKSTGDNIRNTGEDIDYVVMSLNKFVQSCVKGTPNDIELLFVDDENIKVMTEIGKELRENRHLFLTKKVRNRFGGYAERQKKMMEKSNRVELVEQYGYDTKMFMHSVRLYDMAIEVLNTGDLKTKRDNAYYLKELRNGKYTLDEALSLLDRMEVMLNTAYEDSKLPDEVDIVKVNDLLIRLNKKALGLM